MFILKAENLSINFRNPTQQSGMLEFPYNFKGEVEKGESLKFIDYPQVTRKPVSKDINNIP